VSKGHRQKRALFLDRDGVINEERHFVHRVEDFHWQDGIFDLVLLARRAGFAPVVVTNQSGIGRGIFTQADYDVLTRWMCAGFDAAGASLERVYHCPFHEDAILPQYRRAHPWRKPEPGMFLAARDELGLDLEGSLMVGDRWSDAEAAATAGIGTVVVVGPHAAEPAPVGVDRAPKLVRLPSVRAAATWFAETCRREGAFGG
jgi:D-glycero-D-manno-heptose 1,7-bisphosphate phosphatase